MTVLCVCLQSVFGACYCSLGIIGPADCPVTNADCSGSWNTLLTNQGYQHIDVKFAEAVYVSQVQCQHIPIRCC